MIPKEIAWIPNNRTPFRISTLNNFSSVIPPTTFQTPPSPSSYRSKRPTRNIKANNVYMTNSFSLDDFLKIMNLASASLKIKFPKNDRRPRALKPLLLTTRISSTPIYQTLIRPSKTFSLISHLLINSYWAMKWKSSKVSFLENMGKIKPKTLKFFPPLMILPHISIRPSHTNGQKKITNLFSNAVLNSCKTILHVNRDKKWKNRSWKKNSMHTFLKMSPLKKKSLLTNSCLPKTQQEMLNRNKEQYV